MVVTFLFLLEYILASGNFFISYCKSLVYAVFSFQYHIGMIYAFYIRWLDHGLMILVLYSRHQKICTQFSHYVYGLMRFIGP